MTAQPLPKTQELADKINGFVLQYHRPSPFQIQSLKRDIDNLKDKIDIADYWNYKGCIAGFENKKDEIIHCFENAIKLNPNDFIIRDNYGSALINKGLISLAEEQARILFDIFPEKVKLSQFIIEALFLSCRFNDALNLFNDIENKEKIYHYESIARRAIDIFNNVQLSDNEARHLQKLAYSVIEKKNLYYFDALSSITDNCVSFTLYVDLPVEEIFDINWELAGVLAENVKDMRCGVLNFEYSSIEVLRERREYERSI